MRNKLAKIAAGLAITSLAASPTSAAGVVTVVDAGGTWQKATSEALLQPVAKKLGMELREDSWKTLADLRLQVQSGKPTWDIISLPMGECVAGAKEGLFEPMDYAVVTNAADLPPNLRTEFYTVGTVWASFVTTWNKDVYGDRPPQTWADYFNVDGFPGARGAYNAPRFMIEAALIADGVALDKVYPADLDRAFAKLTEFKSKVTVWYTSFGQAVDLVNRGEVDFVPMLDGRIADTILKGANWDFTFNQGIINGACTAVVKGTSNKADAMRFVNEMVNPELQANLVNHFVSYGPMHPGVYETGLIDPEKAKTLNSHPDNMKVQLVLDTEWWGDNRAAVQARWDEMMK